MGGGGVNVIKMQLKFPDERQFCKHSNHSCVVTEFHKKILSYES